MSASTRAEIVGAPDSPLSIDALAELITVRGYGPAVGYWVAAPFVLGEQLEFYLTDSERELVRSGCLN